MSIMYVTRKQTLKLTFSRHPSIQNVFQFPKPVRLLSPRLFKLEVRHPDEAITPVASVIKRFSPVEPGSPVHRETA